MENVKNIDLFYLLWVFYWAFIVLSVSIMTWVT